MSKKKNNEEKEVKTQAEKQEEKETEATDKAEKNAEENPLEKELKDTKEQLLRVTAEYSNFRKRSEKEILLDKNGNMEKIIINVAVLVPVLSFKRKKIGNPTTIAMEKQISCLLVRLNITLVFTVLKSLGIGTYAIKSSFPF